MQLRKEDQEKVKSWIQSKCGNLRCTSCGLAEFTVFDAATLAIGFDVRTTRFFYAQGVPQVSVACTNCGHLLHFSTAIMGFKPEEPKSVDISEMASGAAPESTSEG